MNAEREGSGKSAQTTKSPAFQASQDSPQAVSRNYLLWISTAILLAGVSYILTTWSPSSDTRANSSALPITLPESYGLCTEPGRIYTVDEDKPTVDCIIVRKDEVLATGTKGTILTFIF